MSHYSTYKVAGAAQLKRLRNALAIIHCRRLLSTFQKEAERTISHDQAKRVTYLTELFSRIHREIFGDWKEQVTAAHRPGTMLDADKRKAFRAAIESLVLNGDTNEDTALFDNNGFVIYRENIAERLAMFYYKMRRINPFGYGNKLTLDFFMITLSNLPAFHSVYEHSVDFRRLELGDAAVLHRYDNELAEVIQAFKHAIDPSRTRSLPNRANGYGVWPEQKHFISNIPFLSHCTADGVECLVTVNGGLVPLDSIREELMTMGTHFADYPLELSKTIIDYLPGTEELRTPDKREIDGIPVGHDGAAPLFCLDINLLTGLRAPSHTELMELLKQCAGDSTPIFSLANNPDLRDRLIAAAEGDERLERAVEIAYTRLSRMIVKIDQLKWEIFADKTPDPQPKLFLCMGGAGAGKTAVEEIARAQCGDNFVTASLDEFRKKSDLYKVLTAANHHSDDYIYVEPFANTLRDWVANHARERGFNLLYDGTSIPFVPRYSSIVDAFKSAGFITSITAVDSFIVKPVGREGELSRKAAIGSVRDRFERTGRALPWVVAVDKHIRAPGSFLDALNHPTLDKLSLFANDGEMHCHYLVAESFQMSDAEVNQLQQHQLDGSLADYLNHLARQHDDSALKTLAQGDLGGLSALIDRNPAFCENNVAYQIYSRKDQNRVLLVYNARRMVDFLEKGQLNPNTSGEDGLLHKHASMAFHIDPHTQEPWRIRLQDSASPAAAA